MAIRQILHHPDPRLRTVAATVTLFDEQLGVLVDDMLETMYDAPGIGLAATQINVHQRVVVIDVSSERNSPRHFINPQIIEASGQEQMEEGCLSVPDVFETVTRSDQVRIRAQDRYGDEFEIESGGLLAVCIQHEIDHLDGKLFVDYLSQLKQTRIRKRLAKEQRLAG